MLGGRISVALAAGALACSAGIDGYRVGGAPDNGGTSGHPADGGATGSGGSSGGAGGRVSGGSGGTGAGGAGGAGGAAGAGGTMPLMPEKVPLDRMLSGITAAAWADGHFFLLEAPAHQFWELGPDGAVAGPRTLPPEGTIAPHAFGASADSVYVIASDRVYKVPHAGSSNVAGANLVTKGLMALNGAYAKGYFLIGDATVAGAKAQAFVDADGAVTALTALGTLHMVASDGSNFGLREGSTNTTLLHTVASGANMSLNDWPCDGGNTNTSGDSPVAVHGQTLAWLLVGGQNKLLYFATVTNGKCLLQPNPVIFGTTEGPKAVGLIDDEHALVVDSRASGSGNVLLVGRTGEMTKSDSLPFGVFPKSIVVGEQRAVIVGDGPPTLIRF
jgi:hypothetical protein